MRFVTRAATVVAATILAASPLAAQTSFSLALGASVPTGDAADLVDMGYNVTAGIGIKPPLAPLGLRIEGMFNSFGFKSPSDASMRVMALTANGTYTLVPQFYLIGGLGMYNSKATDLPAGATSDAENDLGFNVGAGVNIPLTGFGTYAEIRFHHISGDGGNFQFIPITFGIRF